MTSTPINIPTRSKLVSNLTLLTLTLAIALAHSLRQFLGRRRRPGRDRC